MTNEDKRGGGWADLDLENLNKSNQEELEIDYSEAEEEVSSNEEEVEVETSVEEVPEKENPEKETEKPKEDAKKSRAQERIRKLVSEKKELAAKLKEAEEALNSTSKREHTVKKSSVEALKQAYESSIDSKTREALAALNEGDNEKYVTLQKEISELQLKNTALDSWHDEEPTEVKYEFDFSTEDEEVEDEEDDLRSSLKKANVPEAGIDWIESNPKFLNDEVYRSWALALNNELIQEGFSPESKKFYEKLDERLSEKFSESSTKGRKNPGPGVMPSSRSPAKTANGKLVVRPTKEDFKTAKDLGIPIERFMAQKRKLEKSSGGWNNV